MIAMTKIRNKFAHGFNAEQLAKNGFIIASMTINKKNKILFQIVLHNFMGTFIKRDFMSVFCFFIVFENREIDLKLLK